MPKFERFSLPPRSVSMRVEKPRLTMMDRQIAALRVEQERERNRIKSREELFDDLTNFGLVTEVDEYGLPISTPYQVPENIPDVLPLPQKDAAEDTKKEDSVSKRGSLDEPLGGAE